MSQRGDDYRQRALAADRRAAAATNPQIRSAYERMARDWLALADQIERIEGYKSASERGQESPFRQKEIL
jgi:hypothetical protein